jgi:hypothetical protein
MMYSGVGYRMPTVSHWLLARHLPVESPSRYLPVHTNDRGMGPF